MVLKPNGPVCHHRCPDGASFSLTIPICDSSFHNCRYIAWVMGEFPSVRPDQADLSGLHTRSRDWPK